MSNQKLQTSDDLALAALSQAQQNSPPLPAGDDQELLASNQMAETLSLLQNIIEKNAQILEKINKNLKEKRQELKNYFDNDSKLSEATEQVEQYTTQVKERKAQLNSDPQSMSLKTSITDLKQEKKEIEDALSNHLVNYHHLTGSKSFDTSDGDQWEFDIKARVKARKK